ncbi:TPA: hypothetical protein DCQ44_00765, partial [Candidatus Taylorbacteria bacterium]|nr:hypothetical protein [Candidatus Taylorbacteria bacterium]
MSQLYKIPFYPQIWKLDEWKDLGFKDLDEARYWQNASCGILCLKMAIEGVLGKQIDSISQIIVKGRLAGAYSHKFGWSHTGLAALAISYDTEAFVLENMGVERIKSFIDQGMLVIVSIKWAFEPARSLKERLFFWKKKGGHLALVT